MCPTSNCFVYLNFKNEPEIEVFDCFRDMHYVIHMTGARCVMYIINRLIQQ